MHEPTAPGDDRHGGEVAELAALRAQLAELRGEVRALRAQGRTATRPEPPRSTPPAAAAPEVQAPDTGRGSGPLKRRGLLAGLGALTAGLLAQLTQPRVQAATGDFLQAGVAFTETNGFMLTNNYGTVTNSSTQSAGTAAVFVGTDGWEGIRGVCYGKDGWGVSGDTNIGTGVRGSAQSSGIGVYGSSYSGRGVWGFSSTNTGVFGTTAAGPGIGNAGVYGSGGSAHGVLGVSETAYGVLGNSTDGVALGGNSNYIGLFGSGNGGATGVQGTSQNGIAMYGSSNGPQGTGVYGASTNGWAARFQGTVLVGGSFSVTGGAKSALVPHPDGQHRRVYCQESPEPWFEDFGDGALVNGRAQVQLDREFAAVVSTEGYRVFLTALGDCNGLYVVGQTPTGFEVRELRAGTSALPFTYRVVCKRKDIAGPRLEKVRLPEHQPARTAPPMTVPAADPTPPTPRR